MKIVTYNVNGLRQRVAQHGSLLKLLNSLDADIICFQETKLARQDLSVDLTFAEGYEAFLSCTRSTSRGRFAYSGVATFCWVKSAFGDEAALPVAAEEGFTGLLEVSKKWGMVVGDFEVELPLNVEGLEDVTNEDLLKADSEGRCGHFVLFNLYGPRAEEDNKERLQFKLLFFKILQKRWELLLSQGRRVVVGGDINIAPAAIDRCDAAPGFEKNIKAYTCFSPRTGAGAEEFNYGSRIDHILIAGPCLYEEDDMDAHNFLNCHAEECDIMIQFKRGNPATTPKWQGGRTIKLDGSDRIPVYAVPSDIPNLHVHNTPPPLAVRYVPEVRGCQQTIVSFVRKTENHTGSKHMGVQNCQVDKSTEAEDGGKCALTQDCKTSSTSHHCRTTVIKKAKRSSTASSQLMLKVFFKQPKIPNIMDTSGTEKKSQNMFQATESSSEGNLMENIEESSSELIVPTINTCGQDPDDINLCLPSKIEKGSYAVLEWQKIQEKMRTSIPLCKGHHEPCVARSVKKGSNIGRRFYVCARAKGPETEPEANCDYFQRATVKSKLKRN